MVDKVDTARVMLWGKLVGAVSWLHEHDYAVFEYESAFLNHGLDISPVHMSLDKAKNDNRIFSFSGLNKDTFLGLPGLLADALPDKFGHHIIDAWLARNGRNPATFSPIERLCYTGRRGMGALEFLPPVDHDFDRSIPVEIAELVNLAQGIMKQRNELSVALGHSDKQNTDAMLDILRVSTSAGGARPKAVIAMDNNGHVLSGQTEAPPGYEYWLLKFDGVTDLELGEPRGYGRIEYAYYLMAKASGISMMECQLLTEHQRAHFITKRFDRHQADKKHMQTLCGLAHYDFNMAGAYSYEQAFSIMRHLKLDKADAIEFYRRMVFNVIARNQDDHTKNITFLMNKTGSWKLSPAYDVTYSHNPHGKWTNQHQMSINGKRDHFTREDLITVGEQMSVSAPDKIINEVSDAVSNWKEYALEAGVSDKVSDEISRYHRKLG